MGIQGALSCVKRHAWENSTYSVSTELPSEEKNLVQGTSAIMSGQGTGNLVVVHCLSVQSLSSIPNTAERKRKRRWWCGWCVFIIPTLGVWGRRPTTLRALAPVTTSSPLDTTNKKTKLLRTFEIFLSSLVFLFKDGVLSSTVNLAKSFILEKAP